MNNQERTRTSGLRHISEILDEALGLESLPVTDPKHPDGFELEAEVLTLHWGNYPYYVNRDRIDTPEKALGWIAHVGEKGWSGATAERISNLIRALGHAHGWHLQGM